jgi:hypothetical protein
MQPALPSVVALFRSLASGDNTTYVLSEDLRITRVNDAWTRFARANGGEDMLVRCGRGTRLLDSISGDLRELHRELLDGVATTSERCEYDYECSSAETERTFRMVVFPAEARYLVVTHSLRIERPHHRPAMAADDQAYTRDGFIRMCSNCRRVSAIGANERWDWVPAYVSAMPDNVSHGLCPPCFETFRVLV